MPEPIVSEISQLLNGVTGHSDVQPGGHRSLAQERLKPSRLGTAALHGFVGDLVKTLMPHTESAEAALVVQFLVAAGIYLGRNAHYLVEGDRHFTNVFAAVVGATSKGRKGTSWGQVKRLLRLTDATFVETCIKSGLSSGEGLIWVVRDEIWEHHQIKDKAGRVQDYQSVLADPGVSDKRLLVQEPEFARVLKSAERESNTISAVIREAWDSGTLNILTKNKAARATNAHIGIIVHITAEELRRYLNSIEAANGFANRFLWVFSERSKELPFGGSLSDHELEPFAARLRDATADAVSCNQLTFDLDSALCWKDEYSRLSAGGLGVLGAILGRSEAHVVRLAILYALLDCSKKIRLPHLRAALAIWDYCEASAQYIFGGEAYLATAERILTLLTSRGNLGATRSDLSNFFKRNKSSEEIGRALDLLHRRELVHWTKERTEAGGSTERWFAGHFTPG